MLRIKSNNVYFTSDTHFFHKNIIKYCDRPFESVENMNDRIISQWNSIVSPDDIVFHLGDVCFGGKQKWLDTIGKCNGTKFLIKGNHDMESPPEDIFWDIFNQEMIIVEDEEIGEQKVFMHHFPFLTWPEQAQGCWQLFGHIHSKNGESVWKDSLKVGQYDVGMDNNDYKPVSFQEIKEIITKQYLYAGRTL